MGGCRCTYRNCTVKSDGKTHMFRYPVFDKVRCHQWLINAHRLEFLNLKVSQLKNRVVCQHHFKDEYFMNFKKDKLTFEAIPTEDGPYCDPNKWVDNSQEFSKLYTIVLDDIENEYFSLNDKKANYSLKYLDFLTNSESMESSYLSNETNTLLTTQCNNLDKLNFLLDSNIDDKTNTIHHNIDESNLLNDKLTSIKNKINKPQTQPILIVPPYSEKSNVEDTLKSKEYLEFDIHPYLNKITVMEPKIQQPKPKVRIISEKKITKPVPISGSFEPISPSVILNMSHLKRNDKRANIVLENRTPTEQHDKIIIQEEIEPTVLQKHSCVATQKTEKIQKIKASIEKPNITSKHGTSEVSKISLLKNKISPERIAAIEEKRKFNMKLKDIIESCVIKMEEPDKCNEEKLEHTDAIINQKVPTSPEKEVLQKNEGYLSSLEARMSRMENLLLNKIDQNSQRIMDLKNSLGTTSQKKKSVSTQTIRNEEANKKFLYNEISKYLSAESNNLIYQELFIDKFAQNASTHPTTFKRREV